MAEDPHVSTAGVAVTTAVTTGGIVATQSSVVASTNLTQATNAPLASSQIQLQALQVALQAAQTANGGLLNTSVASDVQQVPIFSPGMAVPGPFNLGSMFSSLPGITHPPPSMDVNSLAGVVSRMALEHNTLLKSKRERDIDIFSQSFLSINTTH